MIEIFLDAGASPNALASDIESPCVLAILNGQLDPIRVLMKSGGGFQLQKCYCETVLYLAARAEVKDALALLMTEHDLYAENILGQSVLYEISGRPWTFSMTRSPYCLTLGLPTRARGI